MNNQIKVFFKEKQNYKKIKFKNIILNLVLKKLYKNN